MVIKVNGIDLYWEELGEGEPLLWLHGGLGHGADWNFIFKEPPAGHRLIAPDLRGHGRSTGAATTYSFRQSAVDAFALLDHLRIDRCHLYGQCIGGSFILSLLQAQPDRVASAVLAQPIGRVGAMPPGRSARFDAWAETLTDHPEATPAVLDALYRNLYAPGFVYCVDRAFVSTCATPCLVLAGNDEAHPLPISEELARLLPRAEMIREWKAGDALTSARARVQEFLSKHTPRGVAGEGESS